MSIIRDIFFGGAEKKAAKAQQEGITAGIEEQRRQFDVTQKQFAPTLERGDIAGEKLGEFLGLRGPEAEEAAISGFRESPGQAFLRKRQERSLLRNEAAIGGLGGGNVRTALQEQAFGIASTQLGERKDRLAQVAGAGTGALGQVSALGANVSGNIASQLGQRGQAKAGGILGRASGIRGGLTRVAGAFI